MFGFCLTFGNCGRRVETGDDIEGNPMHNTWPSPAEEELTDARNLDAYLIRNPEAVFLLRMQGDALMGIGVMSGDLLIVERGRTPKNGNVVVAYVDDAWLVRVFERRGDDIRLLAAHPNIAPHEPSESLCIDGVVTAVVRKYV